MKTSVVQEQGAVCQKKSVMFFPDGIIGFSGEKEFKIMHDKSKEPFLWLESVKDQDLSFIIIEPKEFKPDYNPVISEMDKRSLQISDAEQCSFYALVCVPSDSDEITANLLAPIVINRQNNIGRQVILTDQDYDVQHLILEEMLRKIEDTDVSSFAQTK